MLTIPDKVKEKVREPLGRVETEGAKIKKTCAGSRVIAVGDICVLELLRMCIMPHLAVFDFVSKRQPLDKALRNELEKQYPKPARYKNPQGTLSEKLIEDAAMLVDRGGAVRIDGEEDLTTLAFIIGAKDGDIVAYGQPDKGLVLVIVDEKIKNKVRKLISAARTLGHEVE
jgi:uncharacterized protein (UPF0218 family)